MTPNFKEKTWRDRHGGLVIHSRIDGSKLERRDYERRFFPGVEIGLAGWHRAHSQGMITGHESPEGIRYAPAEVNQQFQRLGIERYIRDLLDITPPKVELYLATTTYTHKHTLRLKEITYRIDAAKDGKSWPLFEASIEVENRKDHPRVTASVKSRTMKL